MHRGLAERSIVGVLWTASSAGAQAIFQVVALVVLARLLSPNEFGLFAAILVVTGFSSIFSGLGVGPAIVQRPELEERHLRVGFTLSLLLGNAVAGLVWAGAPNIASFFNLADLTQMLRAACLVFVCQGFAMVAQALAQRELRFRWLAGVDAGAYAVGFVIVGPVLAWFGYGVWALVGALLTQHVLRMVMLLAGQPHPKRLLLERRAIAELLYFGGGFTLARIGNYLASQLDKLIVGRWLGAEALGLYALTYGLVSAPATLVGKVLDRVLFPAMARVQFEPARLVRGYRSSIAVCALLVLPASVTVAILAPEIVLVLLGPAWSGGVVPLQILALGMLFRASYKLSDSVARAMGAVYARAWRQAVFACAVAAGALIGQFWGVQGVAFGVVAAIAINYALMAQLSLRLTGMRLSEFAVAHMPGLALAVVVGVVVWLLSGWLLELQVPPLIVLLSVTLFACVEVLLVCWCLPAIFVGNDGRSLLRMLAALASAQLQRRALG